MNKRVNEIFSEEINEVISLANIMAMISIRTDISPNACVVNQALELVIMSLSNESAGKDSLVEKRITEAMMSPIFVAFAEMDYDTVKIFTLDVDIVGEFIRSYINMRMVKVKNSLVSEFKIDFSDFPYKEINGLRSVIEVIRHICSKEDYDKRFLIKMLDKHAKLIIEEIVGCLIAAYGDGNNKRLKGKIMGYVNNGFRAVSLLMSIDLGYSNVDSCKTIYSYGSDKELFSNKLKNLELDLDTIRHTKTFDYNTLALSKMQRLLEDSFDKYSNYDIHLIEKMFLTATGVVIDNTKGRLMTGGCGPRDIKLIKCMASFEKQTDDLVAIAMADIKIKNEEAFLNIGE